MKSGSLIIPAYQSVLHFINLPWAKAYDWFWSVPYLKTTVVTALMVRPNWSVELEWRRMMEDEPKIRSGDDIPLQNRGGYLWRDKDDNPAWTEQDEQILNSRIDGTDDDW